MKKHSVFLKLLIAFLLFTTLQSGGCKKDEVVNPIIGTTGPAGGIVFYDKGSYSDGWRYLEMAPYDAVGGSPFWGCNGLSIPAVQGKNAIGMGKSNTQAILDSQANGPQTSGSCDLSSIITAAEACDAFVMNGYDDWFLPSIEEVKIMVEVGYDHLVINYDKYYWSSTQSQSNKALALYIYGNPEEKPKETTLKARAIRAY